VFHPVIRINHRIMGHILLERKWNQTGRGEEREMVLDNIFYFLRSILFVRCIKSQNLIRELCDPSFNV
jgi:hypothetical protein